MDPDSRNDATGIEPTSAAGEYAKRILTRQSRSQDVGASLLAIKRRVRPRMRKFANKLAPTEFLGLSVQDFRRERLIQRNVFTRMRTSLNRPDDDAIYGRSNSAPDLRVGHRDLIDASHHTE